MDMKEWMETPFIKGWMEDVAPFIDEHPDFSEYVFEKALQVYNEGYKEDERIWWFNPKEVSASLINAFDWAEADEITGIPQLFRAFHYWSTGEDPRITLDELYVFDAPHLGKHKVRVA